MILYVISGAEGAGKTTLCRRLVGAANVWDLDAARSIWRSSPDFAVRLIDHLKTLRGIVAPRCALDGIQSLEEIKRIREALPHDQIVHFHVVNGSTEDQPTVEMIEMGIAADYAITWTKCQG